jgi:hypothetical protein
MAIASAGSSIAHDQVPTHLDAMEFWCATKRQHRVGASGSRRMVVAALASAVPVMSSDSGDLQYLVNGASVIVKATMPGGFTQSAS